MARRKSIPAPVRIFNAHSGHFSLNSRKVTRCGSRAKVTPYVTKRAKGKAYLNGRVLLPHEICEKGGRLHKILHSKPAHVMLEKKDMWGDTLLLLFPEPPSNMEYLTISHSQLLAPCNSARVSRVSTHRRTAKGKKYSAAKIYVHHSWIGKEVIFLRIRSPVRLRIHDLSGTRGSVRNATTMHAQAYLLFCENIAARLGITPRIAVHAERSYMTSLRMISEGNTVRQVARKRKISADTVWSHIALGMRKEDLSPIQAKDIFVKNCVTASLSNDITIFLEALRFVQHREAQKLLGAAERRGNSTSAQRRESLKLLLKENETGARQKILLKSKRELQRKFYEEFHVRLPMSMIDVLKLYLDSLQK